MNEEENINFYNVYIEFYKFFVTATMIYAAIPKVINEMTDIKYFGETLGFVNVIMYLGQSVGANFSSVIMDKRYLQAIFGAGVKNITVIFMLLSTLSIISFFISISRNRNAKMKNI